MSLMKKQIYEAISIKLQSLIGKFFTHSRVGPNSNKIKSQCGQSGERKDILVARGHTWIHLVQTVRGKHVAQRSDHLKGKGADGHGRLMKIKGQVFVHSICSCIS